MIKFTPCVCVRQKPSRGKVGHEGQTEWTEGEGMEGFLKAGAGSFGASPCWPSEQLVRLEIV